MTEAEADEAHHDGWVQAAPPVGPDRPDITKLQALFHGPIDVRSVALTGLFVLACLYTLSIAQPVFIPITAAVILSVLLGPVVRSLRKLKCPEPVAAALVLGTVAGLVSTGGYLLIEPATDWIAKAPSAFETIERKARNLKRSFKPMTQATAALEQMTALEKSAPSAKVEIKGPSLGGTVIQFTKGFIAASVTTLVLLYFLLASGDFFLEKLVRVLPRLSDKKRAVEIVREIEDSVSHYLTSVTLINLGVGTAVGVAMAWFGMPNPLLWGAAAALLHFIPYVGSLVGLVTITVVALLTFEDPAWIVLIVGSYWAISALEATVVTPLVLGQRLTLSPVMILMSLLFWGWLWGIPGALLAVPLLASLKIVCDHLEPLHSIGEFLGR